MKRETFHEIAMTPFDVCLDVWVRWMKLVDRPHSDGEGNLQDNKEFMQQGEAIETMVNELPRIQWWSVRKASGICTVWNFPNASLEVEFDKAKDTLSNKMKKHVATKRYFN